MRESQHDHLSARTSRTAVSVAVYGDISLADRMILRGPTGRLDLVALYLTAGRLAGAVCIGQTVLTERLVQRAVARRAIPVANLADPEVALEDAFFSPPSARAA